jgi:hypothetical protein
LSFSSFATLPEINCHTPNEQYQTTTNQSLVHRYTPLNIVIIKDNPFEYQKKMSSSPPTTNITQRQRHQIQHQLAFIDYFNLLERYMRQNENSNGRNEVSNLLFGSQEDKEEEEEEEEMENDDEYLTMEDDESTAFSEEEVEENEESSIQLLHERCATFVNGIRHRLLKSSSDNLSALFYDDVFGALKSVLMLAKHFGPVEHGVRRCYQIIQEKYCKNGADDMNSEQLLAHYKNQNEVIHRKLLELDASCAYSFEYIRFRCCKDLLSAFSQREINRIIKKLHTEQRRITQNLSVCNLDKKQEEELLSRQEYAVLASINERHSWYTMLLHNIQRYLEIASDLSLSLQASKRML